MFDHKEFSGNNIFESKEIAIMTNLAVHKNKGLTNTVSINNTLINLLDYALLIINSSGEIVDYNSKFLTIIGAPVPDAQTNNLTELDVSGQLETLLKKVILPEFKGNFITPFFKHDGGIDTLRFELLNQADEKSTEDRYIKVSLASNNENEVRQFDLSTYETIFYNSNAVMFVLNPETGKILKANDAALKFYGYTLEEFLQLQVNDINVLDSNDIKSRINEVLNDKHYSFSFKHKLKDGSLKDVLVYCSKMNILDKTYIFSIVHDITEKNQIERKLMLQSDVLENIN
ncbi:MAG: PAS domain S-box protein [Bacteroidales bacterium]|nr:PAS domain S-box protein [Bacteroidales bacterium]